MFGVKTFKNTFSINGKVFKTTAKLKRDRFKQYKLDNVKVYRNKPRMLIYDVEFLNGRVVNYPLIIPDDIEEYEMKNIVSAVNLIDFVTNLDRALLDTEYELESATSRFIIRVNRKRVNKYNSYNVQVIMNWKAKELGNVEFDSERKSFRLNWSEQSKDIPSSTYLDFIALFIKLLNRNKNGGDYSICNSMLEIK